MPRTLFAQKVVKIALAIPPGRVTTYGRIAAMAGGGGMASQSITAILGKAEAEGVRGIPYHRIVYADGRVWIDAARRKKRLALYAKEGIKLDERDRIIDFEKKLIG
jgi:methylated-DNA-protein-cysteine methyltransferase related protein